MGTNTPEFRVTVKFPFGKSVQGILLERITCHALNFNRAERMSMAYDEWSAFSLK